MVFKKVCVMYQEHPSYLQALAGALLMEYWLRKSGSLLISSLTCVAKTYQLAMTFEPQERR